MVKKFCIIFSEDEIVMRKMTNAVEQSLCMYYKTKKVTEMNKDETEYYKTLREKIGQLQPGPKSPWLCPRFRELGVPPQTPLGLRT